MKTRCKFLIICFVLLLCVVTVPAVSVFADEVVSGETTDRNSFPRLNAAEIKFEKKHFSNWFGLRDIPDENCIEEFVLAHRKLENIDYTLYELVCDFELKTMGTGEAVTTSNYSYTIDFSDYERGLIDSLLVQFNLKEDYFEHVFNYFEIVRNAEGFQEKDITGKEKYFTYNTVISKADFYFVRKSDGAIGQARRFVFTWDSDFWLQKCTKIDYMWYEVNEDYEKPVDFIENLHGIDGFNNSYTNDLEYDELSSFLIDLPAVLVRLVRGFIDFFIDYLPRLLKVVFPFLPIEFFYYLGTTFILSILVCIWKIVRG